MMVGDESDRMATHTVEADDHLRRDRVRAVFPKCLFVEGDDLYRDMLQSISRARRRVCLETYIFADDALGRRFVRALIERAEQGVTVHVLVDAFGSLGMLSRRSEHALRHVGARVRRFHRWQWRSPLRYNRRDHRKLLVVDGQTAYVGGFNIHEESSLLVHGGGRWRDTHLRIEGALAREAEAHFETFWYRRWREQRAVPMPANDVLVSNHGAHARRRLHYLINDLLDTASDTLWLTTPYFVPDRPVQRRLIRAVRRGVDVRVLMPGKNDVRLARWASHAAYAPLLAAGVRLFEYRPRMLHAKTMVADGNWALVGSSNLDYRSFRHNYEINLSSADPALCRSLERVFLADQSQADEIGARNWARRPWLERSAEVVGWAARRWL